jgi:UDP-2-acetamido-3-amino-2,3-dideoxy-glucuronate N-acetyltransferase
MPALHIHPSAIVDEGAQTGRRHTRVALRARLRRRPHRPRCSLGQGVFVGNDVVIGDNVQGPEQRLGLRRGDAGRRCLLRPQHGLHQRLQPACGRAAQGEYRRTLVKRGATLGANCTIVCGSTVGEYAFVGAGAVVNRDVPAYALMVGVPARRIGWMSRHGERLALPASGEGEAACPATGERYRLEGEP